VIGIDVGGTNTDAVLMHGKRVVAWDKSPTCDQISEGVSSAIGKVLGKSGVSASHVSFIKLGTTVRSLPTTQDFSIR
jgi:N-methylhydantoinase A/oxoprolinase/acetone carboxylase beta subunit